MCTSSEKSSTRQVTDQRAELMVCHCRLSILYKPRIAYDDITISLESVHLEFSTLELETYPACSTQRRWEVSWAEQAELELAVSPALESQCLLKGLEE